MANPPPQVPVFNLTVRYNGRTNVIVSDIEICEAFDPKQVGPRPQMKKFHCIWDTGATNSVINSKVVQAIGLKPSGKVEVHTAGGNAIQNTYLVNMRLPSSVGFSLIRVTEGNLEGPQDVLIGMDIIGMGDFAITNHQGNACMTFRVPSMSTLDFTASGNHPPPKTPQHIAAPVQGRNMPCYCGSGKKYKHCHGR
jgi:hypothetical protein